MPTRTTMPGLIPIGFQSMSLSNSTVGSINSTVRAAQVLDISVETQDARFLINSTGPAMSTGVLLPKGFYRWTGYAHTANLKFQRTTGVCKISIQGYTFTGGG